MRWWRISRWIGIVAALAIFAGCAARQPAPPPALPPSPSARITGVASWYGPGFNGHRTASGAIYNEDDLTAAANMYALGSHVMVTNLDNDRSVEVVINDRGPFVKGRVIDLSYRAAHVIGMVGPGTARVSLDLLNVGASSGPPHYYVQVGAFSEASNAQRLLNSLLPYYSDTHIYPVNTRSGHYYRVRMGAFLTRAQAQARARQALHLDLPIIIVSN